MEFDGVYEEGDELTSEEREWVESDDGILSVLGMLDSLVFTHDFPYEYIETKSFTGRKGYKSRYYVVKRKSDGKFFEYHTSSSRNHYEELITEYDLVEARQIITKVWDFEADALNRD